MALEYLHELRVRYAETDQMGVVYHANYLVYLEEARIRLMEAIGFPYEEVERQGLAMVVRKAEVRYRVPILFGDKVVVRTTVERVRGASILYAYALERVPGESAAESQGDELYASATTEIGCVTREGARSRPVPLPDPIRRALGGEG